MSLEKIAKHLEQHGRGDDTHLVHMTTGELGALQKLAQQHGGSLTLNPHTGLPEAGFLSHLLPMIAGVGLDLISGGALTPLTTGLIVGAGDAAITGSLKNGLMAGLGAWSGANLAGGLVSTGAADITQQAGEEAAKQYATASQQALSTPELDVTEQLPLQQQIATQQISNMSNLTPDQISAYKDAVAQSSDPSSLVRSAGAANAGLGATPTQMAQAGLSNATGSLSGAKDFAMANPTATAALGLTALSGLAQQPTVPGVKQQVNPFGLKTLSPNFNGQPVRPPTPYVPQYVNYAQNPYNAATGAAHGGVMHMASGGDDISEMMQGLAAITKRQNIPESTFSRENVVYRDSDPSTQNLDAYNTALKRLKTAQANAHMPTKTGLAAVNALGALNMAPHAAAAQQAAADIVANSPEETTAKEGGLQGHHEHKYNLGGYSDGGRLLKGPGDGVSDGIPATIGDKQPARLADGEFVIPARIVSELGNGSTDAGAKRLYAMMDRIKHARAKAKDIAADTKAYKYLPA